MEGPRTRVGKNRRFQDSDNAGGPDISVARSAFPVRRLSGMNHADRVSTGNQAAVPMDSTGQFS